MTISKTPKFHLNAEKQNSNHPDIVVWTKKMAGTKKVLQ